MPSLGRKGRSKGTDEDILFWKSLRQKGRYVSNRIIIRPTWSEATHTHNYKPEFQECNV